MFFQLCICFHPSFLILFSFLASVLWHPQFLRLAAHTLVQRIKKQQRSYQLLQNSRLHRVSNSSWRSLPRSKKKKSLNLSFYKNMFSVFEHNLLALAGLWSSSREEVTGDHDVCHLDCTDICCHPGNLVFWYHLCYCVLFFSYASAKLPEIYPKLITVLWNLSLNNDPVFGSR